jgi:DNA polymerase-3 subunit delta'
MTSDDAYDLLRRGFEAQRLASGYIVNGAVDGGGLTLVNRMLALLFCQNRTGCGACQGCLSAREHTHPDLFWVEPQKKSRTISVEQVRDFQKLMFQTSFVGGWKVCVIRSADRLGSEASNAFLKVLEEPPGMAVFFLLTDSPQALLPTIRSRCQIVTVFGESEILSDTWRERLAGILQSIGGRDTVSVMGAAGRLGKMMEEMKKLASDEIAEAAEAGGLDEDDETLEARATARYREWRAGIFRFMILWYRDMLLSAHGADNSLLAHPAHAETIRRKAGGLDIRTLQRNVDAVEQMHIQMEKNVPESMALNAGLGRIG